MSFTLAEAANAPGKCTGSEELRNLWMCTQNADAVSRFLSTGSRRESETVCDKLVMLLNDEEESSKDKAKALVVLSQFALCEEYRDVVLDSIRHMEEEFEKLLDSKVDKSMGRVTSAAKTGSELHKLLLLLLLRVTDYTLSTADLLDMVRHDSSLALALVEATLKAAQSYEPNVGDGCGNLLLGFSQPDTFYNSAEDARCKEFTQKINRLVDMLHCGTLVQTIASTLSVRVTNICEGARFFKSVASLYLNCYFYSSVPSAAEVLRQHLVVATDLAAAMCSFCAHFSKMQDDVPQIVAKEVHRALLVALKLLTLLAYNIPDRLRETFLEDNFSIQMLSRLEQHPKLFALVCLFMVNINLLSGDATEKEIEKIWEGLPESSKKVVRRLFMVPGVLPISREKETYETICSVMSEKLHKEEEEEEGGEENFRLLGDLPPLGKKPAVAVAPRSNIANTLIRRHKIASERARRQLSSKGNTVPEKFRCALGGHLMRNPVRSPFGHIFERETILEWIRRCGTVCPVTNGTMSEKDLVPDKELANEIASFHIRQMWAANSSSSSSSSSSKKAEEEEDDEDMYSF